MPSRRSRVRSRPSALTERFGGQGAKRKRVPRRPPPALRGASRRSESTCASPLMPQPSASGLVSAGPRHLHAARPGPAQRA
eukprot:2673681-Prymnesium_polylepis.1